MRNFSFWSATRLLCTEARHVGIAAIPHIRFHMCQQISASARPLIRRGVESPDGDLALPCPRRASASPGVASAAPPTLRVSPPRRTRMRPKAAHEFPRMKSQSPLLYIHSIRLGISILCSYGANYGKKVDRNSCSPRRICW